MSDAVRYDDFVGAGCKVVRVDKHSLRSMPGSLIERIAQQLPQAGAAA